jgi:hypothetical protein
MVGVPSEKPVMPRVRKTIRRKANIMGDKSPKATNKLSSQKQSKDNNATQQKNQAIAAKQAAGKKK